jgi:hypothetical protein
MILDQFGQSRNFEKIALFMTSTYLQRLMFICILLYSCSPLIFGQKLGITLTSIGTALQKQEETIVETTDTTFYNPKESLSSKKAHFQVGFSKDLKETKVICRVGWSLSNGNGSSEFLTPQGKRLRNVTNVNRGFSFEVFALKPLGTLRRLDLFGGFGVGYQFNRQTSNLAWQYLDNSDALLGTVVANFGFPKEDRIMIAPIFLIKRPIFRQFFVGLEYQYQFITTRQNGIRTETEIVSDANGIELEATRYVIRLDSKRLFSLSQFGFNIGWHF